jgi:prevent-host-death family protein
MKSLSVSAFREQITGLLDRLPPEGVLVTKRGKPVARLVPVQKKTHADWIGCMKGRLKIRGNIFSTGRKWDAQS